MGAVWTTPSLQRDALEVLPYLRKEEAEMNIADYKLGMRFKAPNPKTLMLGRYLTSPRLDPPPEECDYTPKVTLPWGMMRNDRVGCCVLAGGGHTLMAQTANRGHLFIPSDDAILGAYSAITGYDPAKTDASGYNPTDQGTDPLSGLKHRQKVGIDGRRIGAYGSVNSQDIQRIKQVIYLFESAEIALALPYVTPTLKEWDIPPGQDLNDSDWQPWGWGGHYVQASRYNERGCWVMTWGEFIFTSWAWIGAYGVGVYGVLSEDMLDLTTGRAPSGLDVAALTEDLEAVTA